MKNIEIVKIIASIMPVIIGFFAFLLIVTLARTRPKVVWKKPANKEKKGKFLVLFFALAVVFSKTNKRKQTIKKVYERVNNQLREKKGFFDYEKIEKFLLANGAAYHYGTKINPIKLTIYRLILATIGFMFGIQFHTIFAVIMTIFGFQAPVFMLTYLNTKDNQKMLPEIRDVYSTLQVQIRSGIHITNALAECYHSIESRRLRKNLEELTNEIYIKKSVEEAVNHFNQKFNNGLIDTLCNIIMQAQESGQIVELLADIAEQIKDMQSAILLKRKEKLDRQITLYTLVLVAAIIAVILYACVNMMFESAAHL